MKILIKLVVYMILGSVLAACATKNSSYTSSHMTGQNATWEANGVVARFLMTPVGEIDGFILEDGMQIRFPPKMSAAITKSITIGDSVSVKGWTSSTNAMWADKIVTLKNANEIKMTSDTKGRLVEPKKQREKAIHDLESMTVTGEIDTLIHEPTGEVSGFLLNEGSIVRLPADIRTPLRAYDVGQYVEVTGYGSEGKFGKSVEASTVQRQQTDYEIDYE